MDAISAPSFAPTPPPKLFVDARSAKRGHTAAGWNFKPHRARPRTRRQSWPISAPATPGDSAARGRAPQAGRRRGLARHHPFGYRRRIRGRPCPGQAQGRGGAQSPPQGLKETRRRLSGRAANPDIQSIRAPRGGESLCAGSPPVLPAGTIRFEQECSWQELPRRVHLYPEPR